MEKPNYFDEMQPYLPQDIEGRIAEVETALAELRTLKHSHKLSAKDTEDMSDNYQYHLEWNDAISSLTDELACLKYQQYVDLKNESLLNAYEAQNC